MTLSHPAQTSRRLLRPLATSIAALFLAGSAHAQIAWSPGPADGAWTNVANWVGGNVPNTNAEQALFEASTVTAINLSATITINKAIFAATSPGYTFSGSQLILDINNSGTASVNALEVVAGAGPVTFDNSVNFRDSNANNSQPIISVGLGTVVDFNAAVSTTSNRNLSVNGGGTVNFNANSFPNLGTGQLQQAGNGTIQLFSNPAAVGQIRAFGNAGSIRIHTDLNRPLGIGVTGGNTHEGKIYLSADGVITSGALSTGGGSGTGTNTMDVTFGADIPGSGIASHSGSFAMNGLNAGLTGSTGLVRLDVGDQDTLVMTGAITGIAAGYTQPEFRKQGPGTAILTGANTYTLPTRVAEGTLILTPAQTGNSAVTVDDGTTLGVRLQNTGTLNLASLSVGTTTGATLVFDTVGLGNPAVPIINTGAFDPNADTTLEVTGSSLTSGTFRLIDYTSIAPDGFSRLNLLTPFRISGALVDAADGAVDVTLAVNTPRWNGNLSGNWDINDGVSGGTENWRTLTSNVATHYIQGANTDIVLFNDDAQGTTTVNLTTTLTPVGVTVANNTLPYTFTGPGKISGAASLTKTGTGTLLLANTATYDHSGGTFVNGGTLQVGDGATAGAGFLPEGIVVNNATIVLNRPDDFEVASLLSGTGALVKEQANTVTFNAPTTAGPVVIGDGALRFDAGGNLTGIISGDGGLHVTGGTLQLSGTDANTLTGLTTVSAGILQLNKSAGTDAIAGDLLFTGTGALTRTQANQIADTATITYDKAVNGGSLILNETIGALTMLNGSDTGAQVQGQTGFVVTGLLTARNTSVFSVQSNHSSTVGGLDISGTAIIRVPANSNPSTLTVNELGITASGGTIQVGQGANAFDAVLILNGDVTTTGNLSFTDGNFTGAQLRQINLGSATRTFDIGASTTTTIAPDFAGTGGLTKIGAGTLTLTAASTSTYTGSTTVSAGVLQVNGSLSGTDVLVDGGTLAGTGSITTGGLGLAIVGNGQLSPGAPALDSLGTFTINAAGGELNIGGAGPGSLRFDLNTPASSDKVAVPGGFLNIGVGMLGFENFAFNEMLSPTEGQVFTLFDSANTITGSLAEDYTGPLSGGLFGELRISPDGTDLQLAVVPEPGSAILLLGGLALATASRRRVKR